MTIAFFSSPPYRSLSEKKKMKAKQNKKTNKQTKNKTRKTKRKKQLLLALFRLKWLQISLGSQFSRLQIIEIYFQLALNIDIYHLKGKLEIALMD